MVNGIHYLSIFLHRSDNNWNWFPFGSINYNFEKSCGPKNLGHFINNSLIHTAYCTNQLRNVPKHVFIFLMIELVAQWLERRLRASILSHGTGSSLGLPFIYLVLYELSLLFYPLDLHTDPHKSMYIQKK